jgi:hypothetical protein
VSTRPIATPANPTGAFKSVEHSTIEEELRNQYSLAYTPDRPGDDATYHLIHVTVNQKDLIVQAREGYYSGP